MYFYSQKIPVGVLQRLFDKSLPIAEADLQHHGLPHLKN
jgi:hypothetical protein